jgi:hypothetical protein
VTFSVFAELAASAAVLLGLITAVLGLVNQRNINAAAAAAAEAAIAAAASGKKVDQISVDVDGRLSLFIERQAQLLDALYLAGVPIPDLPALASGPGNPPDPDTETIMAKHTAGDDIAALTHFFETILPAAVVTIDALKAQGLKNLRPLDDLIHEIPRAKKAATAVISAAPAAPATPAPKTALPGEQKLPEG